MVWSPPQPTTSSCVLIGWPSYLVLTLPQNFVVFVVRSVFQSWLCPKDHETWLLISWSISTNINSSTYIHPHHYSPPLHFTDYHHHLHGHYHLLYDYHNPCKIFYFRLFLLNMLLIKGSQNQWYFDQSILIHRNPTNLAQPNMWKGLPGQRCPVAITSLFLPKCFHNKTMKNTNDWYLIVTVTPCKPGRRSLWEDSYHHLSDKVVSGIIWYFIQVVKLDRLTEIYERYLLWTQVKRN